MSNTTAPSTLTGTYAIDPSHSRIGFVARHAMVTKVRGSFNELGLPRVEVTRLFRRRLPAEGS